MFYCDIEFVEGYDDPFSFRVEAEVKVVEGVVHIVNEYDRDKLLGILSGTKFRVWDNDDQPVFEVLQVGRDLSPEEKELESAGPIGEAMGFGGASIFTNKKGTWAISEGVAGFDKVMKTFRMLSRFDVVSQGCRT